MSVAPQPMSFVECRFGDFSGFVRKGFDTPELFSFLSEMEGRIKEIEKRHYDPFRFLKPTDRMVTVVDIPFAGGVEKAVLKQDDFLRDFNLVKFLKYAFKRSRGQRAWLSANAMADVGLSVPLPIAYMERRRFGFFLKGYLFMEYIDGANSLVHALGAGGARLLAKVARAVRELHDSGFFHGDLKPSNMLVREEGGEPRVYFIDLEDMRMVGAVNVSMRTRDLIRLLEDISVVDSGYPSIVLSAYSAERGDDASDTAASEAVECFQRVDG
ncbi:MAG: phosphotransferase [Deltaproteobacteria bacterium]|nr:phosphotransferase [Deltaproteobacteria bacterium]